MLVEIFVVEQREERERERESLKVRKLMNGKIPETRNAA